MDADPDPANAGGSAIALPGLCPGELKTFLKIVDIFVTNSRIHFCIFSSLFFVSSKVNINYGG